MDDFNNIKNHFTLECIPMLSVLFLHSFARLLSIKSISLEHILFVDTKVFLYFWKTNRPWWLQKAFCYWLIVCVQLFVEVDNATSWRCWHWSLVGPSYSVGFIGEQIVIEFKDDNFWPPKLGTRCALIPIHYSSSKFNKYVSTWFR